METASGRVIGGGTELLTRLLSRAKSDTYSAKISVTATSSGLSPKAAWYAAQSSWNPLCSLFALSPPSCAACEVSGSWVDALLYSKSV